MNLRALVPSNPKSVEAWFIFKFNGALDTRCLVRQDYFREAGSILRYISD